MKAFTLALETLGKPRFQIGMIPPTPGLVDQFFNDSTGSGEDGEVDARGPWNTGEEWQFVEAPAFADMRQAASDGSEGRVDGRTTSTTDDVELLEELLVEQLQDLLSAEGQLVKGLPTMIAAAHAPGLRICFEQHLEETQEQLARVKEALKSLDANAKAKPCKGMAGLLEEGQEVIAEGEAAQKVEHYEISGYKTARTLAGQIGRQDLAFLLSTSLGEEETAESLLTQIARELMSESRTGFSKDDQLTDGDTGSATKGQPGESAAKRSARRQRNTT
jgi:Mn-containing catalase